MRTTELDVTITDSALDDRVTMVFCDLLTALLPRSAQCVAICTAFQALL